MTRPMAVHMTIFSTGEYSLDGRGGENCATASFSDILIPPQQAFRTKPWLSVFRRSLFFLRKTSDEVRFLAADGKACGFQPFLEFRNGELGEVFSIG